MKIRYHNVTKKITALDAPEWMLSDAEQTVVDIGNVPLPAEPLNYFRFGTVQNPFVSVKDQVLADEAAAKLARKNSKQALLVKLKIDAADIPALKALFEDGHAD